MDWNAHAVKDLIRLALHEDSARHDLTTHLLIGPRCKIEAAIVAKQKGVIAGLPFAEALFKAMDPSIQFKASVSDGVTIRAGQRLASLKGLARSILSAERPALNALQHLSGIATFTRQQIQKLKGTHARLYDTRKTIPGWRVLQKYAVHCGGGYNHRMSLADAVLIKENHLKIARTSSDDWIARVKSRIKSRLIKMEIQTERDLKDALCIKPQLVLLDNLPPRTLKRMMRVLRKNIRHVEIEFTGGIRPEDLRSLARLGPDRISMGRLTHSFNAFDCSLNITHVYS